jgi:hypothetical protein
MAVMNTLAEQWDKFVKLVDDGENSLFEYVLQHDHHFVRPNWLHRLETIPDDKPLTLPPGYKMYVFYQGSLTLLHEPFRNIVDAVDAFVQEMYDREDLGEDPAFWQYFLKHAIKIWYVMTNKHSPTDEEDMFFPYSKANVSEIYEIFISLLHNGKYKDHSIPKGDEFNYAVECGHLKVKVYSLPTEDYDFGDLNALKVIDLSNYTADFDGETVEYKSLETLLDLSSSLPVINDKLDSQRRP